MTAPGVEFIAENGGGAGASAPIYSMALCGRGKKISCCVPRSSMTQAFWTVLRPTLRRHLDESQRGMVAAKLANIRFGGNQHTTGSANLPTLLDLGQPKEAVDYSAVAPRDEVRSANRSS